ncbi:hypothetical protein [Elizabethkingia anophelis]|uniref:hypothetical protein n=1 Tax=Elizabethkingia anophelis TaxID=1117645 RepID=UPI00293735D4
MKKHILFLILGISFLDIGQERGGQLAFELSSPVERILNLVFPGVLPLKQETWVLILK